MTFEELKTLVDEAAETELSANELTRALDNLDSTESEAAIHGIAIYYGLNEAINVSISPALVPVWRSVLEQLRAACVSRLKEIEEQICH